MNPINKNIGGKQDETSYYFINIYHNCIICSKYVLNPKDKKT